MLFFNVLTTFKVPGPDEHAATFVIRDEDHTLGNALRYVIMKKWAFRN